MFVQQTSGAVEKTVRAILLTSLNMFSVSVVVTARCLIISTDTQQSKYGKRNQIH
jgi:hypothetical protein